MLKKLAAGMFLAALATAGVTAWRGDALRADNKGPAAAQPPGDEVPNGNAANIKPAQKLPITQVVRSIPGSGTSTGPARSRGTPASTSSSRPATSTT
jgi:hypothetical protein